MPSTTVSPVTSKSLTFSSLQHDPRYRVAVTQAVRLKVHQLIVGGYLRPSRPNKQCNGNWKPRMDLVDEPSSPNIIAIFELPGVRNENITLQIKDKRLIVIGKRVDPYAEALAAAASATTNSGAQPQPANLTLKDGTSTPAAATTNSTTGSPNSTSMPIRELRYGSFFRSIPVPEGVKQAEVTAGIQDGVLTVTWPRVPAAARQNVTQMVVDPTTPDPRPMTPLSHGSIRPVLSDSNGTAPALQ